jgi:thiol:disulfide interchange protein DsbD
MDAAVREGKPLFIDFTGHGCVNCREMEQRVWSDPTVQELLRNEFVVVSLYGDDKKNVPEEDWVTLPNGKVLKGLGRINSNFMAEQYGVNAQPAYIIVDHTGTPMMPVRGYNLNVEEYITFLRNGIAAYKQAQQ